MSIDLRRSRRPARIPPPTPGILHEARDLDTRLVSDDQPHASTGRSAKCACPCQGDGRYTWRLCAISQRADGGHWSLVAGSLLLVPGGSSWCLAGYGVYRAQSSSCRIGRCRRSISLVKCPRTRLRRERSHTRYRAVAAELQPAAMERGTANGVRRRGDARAPPPGDENGSAVRFQGIRQCSGMVGGATAVAASWRASKGE